MENDKQSKTKRRNKLFKFLPKATSAVSFQNPPFSPGRDNKKRFSGPLMISIIPTEARTRRPYGGRQNVETPGLGEPTSPKVSCMGQIKQHRKKHIKKKEEAKKPTTGKKRITRFFSGVGGGKHGKGKKSDFDAELTREGDMASQLPERAPALGQMRRFASSRDAFANFDWSAQIAPVDPDQGDYQSDEEGGRHSDYDDEVRIPFSAPMAIGGGGGGGYSEIKATLQPKKEINLWKRRTMAPPRPLTVAPIKN